MTVALLDELSDKLASIPRRRSPVEAPVVLTGAYVDLVFGVGYARAGEADWARARVRAARAKLADAIEDPIHAWLFAAFEARIELVITGRLLAALPAELADRFTALGRVDQYKVQRMLDSVRSLEPVPSWTDAIELFLLKRRGRLVRVAVEDLGQISSLADTDDGDMMAACLRATRLAPAMAADVLDRVLPRLQQHACEDMFGEAIALAARLGRMDAVSRTLDSLAAVRPTMRDMEVATLLIHGADALIADGERSAKPVIDRLEPLVGGLHANYAKRLDELRRVSRGPAPRHDAVEGMPTARYARTLRGEVTGATALAVADEIARMTDSFGTNSHYCLVVIEFVDVLVCAVVDRVDQTTELPR